MGLLSNLMAKSTTRSPVKSKQCGFRCKLDNFTAKRKLNKAKSYGYGSYAELKSAMSQAQTRGRKRAGAAKMKQIEKEEFAKGASGGDFFAKFDKGMKAFDRAMGVKQSSPRRRTTKPKTAKRTTKRTTKRKTAKRTVRRRSTTSNPSSNVWDFGI